MWLDRIAAEKSVTAKQMATKHARQAQFCRQRAEFLKIGREPTGVAKLLERIGHAQICEWRQLELARAEHEEAEARFYQRLPRGPYLQIPRLRILAVWHFIIGGGIRPAEAWPFYEVAYEYVFGKRPSADRDAFKKLLRDFRPLADDLKRRPVRLMTIFDTEAR
jgi:hypothetical protein